MLGQSRGDVEREHPVGATPTGIAQPIWAWLIALGPVLIGALLSVYKETLMRSTQTAAALVFGNDVGSVSIAWWTVAFWALCIGWAIVLALRLQRMDALSADRRLSLIRAIHHVPNLNVVRRYPEFYREIVELLGSEPAGEDTEALAAPIQEALGKVAKMAQTFARATDATYGANVMLVASREGVPSRVIEVLRFHERTNLDALQALLYLPDGLRSTPDSDVPDWSPVIALPVPPALADGGGRRLAVPGAPWALLAGKPAVYEDTRTMEQYCEDFSRATRESIVEYFGESGKGADYRSFASFRVGVAGNPIGILNVDSNRTHVLGASREYYVTFNALIEPVLHLLVPHLAAFAELAWEALKDAEVPADTPEEPTASTPDGGNAPADHTP